MLQQLLIGNSCKQEAEHKLLGVVTTTFSLDEGKNNSY